MVYPLILEAVWSQFLGQKILALKTKVIIAIGFHDSLIPVTIGLFVTYFYFILEQLMPICFVDYGIKTAAMHAQLKNGLK